MLARADVSELRERSSSSASLRSRGKPLSSRSPTKSHSSCCSATRRKFENQWRPPELCERPSCVATSSNTQLGEIVVRSAWGLVSTPPPPPFPPYFPTPHPKLPAQQPWTPPVLRPFRPCRWPRSAPPPPPTWPPPPPTTHWAGQRGASPNTVPRRRSQSTVSPGTGRRLPVKHTGACNSARGGARECSQGHGQQVLCTTYNAYLL